jgi:hypothetical protein
MASDKNQFYKKCVYKNCVNGQVPDHGKHMYRFLSENDGRQYIWICNSGKFIYYI